MQKPHQLPCTCKCGAPYTWDGERIGPAVCMNALHAYVRCGKCGTEGPPVLILPLGPPGAVRAAVEGWNERMKPFADPHPPHVDTPLEFQGNAKA